MMATRSSTKKKQQDTSLKLTFPEPRVLEDDTAENVPSNIAVAAEYKTAPHSDSNKTTETTISTSNKGVVESVASGAGIILEQGNDEDYRIIKGRPSILNAVEAHKEDPLQLYWISQDARNLFRPLPNETVIQGIETQIQLLTNAFNGNNWKTIVSPTADLHKEYFLVPGSVADLKEQAMALSVALDIAKRDKPGKTWHACCEEAVNLIYGQENLISSPSPPTAAKIQEWYREFREHRYFLSKMKRRELQKEKRNENARLKKELQAAKQQNAILLERLENGLEHVKSPKEAVDLLARIELDLSRIKIEDLN